MLGESDDDVCTIISSFIMKFFDTSKLWNHFNLIKMGNIFYKKNAMFVFLCKKILFHISYHYSYDHHFFLYRHNFHLINPSIKKRKYCHNYYHHSIRIIVSTTTLKFIDSVCTTNKWCYNLNATLKNYVSSASCFWCCEGIMFFITPIIVLFCQF